MSLSDLEMQELCEVAEARGLTPGATLRGLIREAAAVLAVRDRAEWERRRRELCGGCPQMAQNGAK